MQRATLLHSFVLLAALSIGCADSSMVLEPIEPALNKGGGGGNTDTDPRAIWEIEGGPMSLIQGDGRDQAGGSVLGAGVSGAYQNGKCGVSGKLWASSGASGDATIDPDGEYSSKVACSGGRRILWVTLGSDHGTREAHFTNVRQVMQLAALGEGASRTQPYQITMAGFAACELLRFGHTVDGVVLGDPIEVTYEGLDASGRRVWTARSTGDHGAVCFKAAKGKYTWDGIAPRAIPFSYRITEVPHGS